LKIKPEKKLLQPKVVPAIMAISKLKKDKTAILEAIKSLSSEGYRVRAKLLLMKNYPKHNKNLHLNSKD
jgi:hypothetical protein